MEYDDLAPMFWAIQEYVTSHPRCEIVSRDSLIRNVVGYHDPRITDLHSFWEISFVGLRASLEKLSGDLRQVLQGFLTNPAGRTRLGELLTSGLVIAVTPSIIGVPSNPVESAEPEVFLRRSRYERVIGDEVIPACAIPIFTKC